jgi:hypothetical protein
LHEIQQRRLIRASLETITPTSVMSSSPRGTVVLREGDHEYLGAR